MGGSVGELWDDAVGWVAEDIMGMPSESDIAKQQAEMEANMAAQLATNQSYMEEEARRARIASIRDTRADRKRILNRKNQMESSKMAGEKRSQLGIRIGGVAAQRGGTGKLKTAKERRMGSTREGFQKWGSKAKGLSLSLRGGGGYSGGRPT